ncbi:MAG: hypothetical protein K0R38_2591 [Polyangiaceae bacterium]|jgi:hypothetical protein|nr:hypothetical protein [Polyangiaceae bacterium]
MQILMRSADTELACDWASYALIRDNVEHFLERGGATQQFSALHAIEHAIDEGANLVPAAKLRGEVLRAWCFLWGLALPDAAISLRTRALMTGALPSDIRGTLIARHAGWELPVSGATGPVPQVAWLFLHTVLTLTDRSVDGDLLEVRRVADVEPSRRSSHSTRKKQH